MSAKTPPKGHASKHVHKAAKHHKAKGKHHQTHVSNPVPSFRVVPPHVIGKPAKHPKPRGFALDGLPVCSLEAVAQSLRLAGAAVSDDDVAGLWEMYGEVSIAEALDVLGGPRVVGRYPVFEQRGLSVLPAAQALDLDVRQLVGDAELVHQRLDDAGRPVRAFAPALSQLDHPPVGDVLALHALILGVDVPGPHAVLATPDGWWSWGELHDPWPCRVEEAWAVSWS